MADGGPPAGTPLADAWRRVLVYAKAAGAVSTTGSYQADIDRDRSRRPAHGVAQAYGIDPDELEQLLIYGWALFVDTVAHGVEPLNALGSVAASFLFTGAELKTDPLEAPAAPDRDKRDVLLDFVSNPDAALNALHQAGWKVVPK